MVAKLVFVVGLLGIGGYVGTRMASYDPNVFPYSRDEVRSMLAAAKTTLPRRDGPGEIKIWSAGRSEKGVTLNMRYASWAPLLTCQAVVTEIAATESRVVADCGGTGTGSAIGDTTQQLRAPMFEEHILATLNKREFDRSRVDSKESAVVMSNLGGMQREALRRSDETQRMVAEADR